jgi:hypothetical protein
MAMRFITSAHCVEQHGQRAPLIPDGFDRQIYAANVENASRRTCPRLNHLCATRRTNRHCLAQPFVACIKQGNGRAIMGYVQTTGTHSTNSSSWTQIPGLSLVIPEGVGTTAIIILNVPWPYAGGDNYPSGSFGIEVDGKLSPSIAGLPTIL